MQANNLLATDTRGSFRINLKLTSSVDIHTLSTMARIPGIFRFAEGLIKTFDLEYNNLAETPEGMSISIRGSSMN